MLATRVKKNPPMGIASAFSGGRVSVIHLQWYMVEIFSLVHVSFITFSWEQERILPVCYILFQKERSDERGQLFLFSSKMVCIWNYWTENTSRKKKIHATTYSE